MLKKLSVTASLLVGFSMLANADVIQPNPVDLYDLNHNNYYVWNIAAPVPTETENVYWAQLEIKNISNWQEEDNTLFINLLDGWTKESWQTDAYALNNVYVGSDYNTADPFEISNFFAGNGINVLSASYGTTPSDVTITFNAAQLATLNAYLSDGKTAFGFDPDCHFYNDGVKFSYAYGVPEPGSLIMLLSGISMLFGGSLISRKRKNK